MLVQKPAHLIPPSRALVPVVRAVSACRSLGIDARAMNFAADAPRSHFDTPCSLIAQRQAQTAQRPLAEATACYARALRLRDTDIARITAAA